MIYLSENVTPHLNLAREALLTETPPSDEPSLFLWQNQKTVVIGYGQNAWRECDLAAMEKDGVFRAQYDD